MGGPDRLALASAAAFLVLGATGCASSKNEPREALPPRAVSSLKPEPPPASEPPVAVPTPPPVVVLDEGGEADPPETLAEASARARAERTSAATKPVAVITDKNLAEFVKDQKLTTVATPAGGTDDAGAAELLTAGGLEESEWRRRGREIRQRWKDAVEAVARLEGEAAALRTRFYSTDDPYVRDSKVKPEWDRALAELEEARRQAEAGPGEVEAFLDEGRRAGALPGWLREGAELEPKPVLETSEGVEVIEPVDADDPSPAP